MVFAMNLESQKVKSKALIKISDVFFDDADVNKIALIAPQVKLSVIKEYEIVEKKKVRVPDTITGLARCFNPQCITNHEAVTTRFSVIKQNEGISLKCHYCEKITIQEHIQLN